MGDILTPKDLPAYVRQVAPQFGVDPAAALSMAQHEGMVGGRADPGDNNTSFGPWQLHIGGALPSSIGALGPEAAQKWAWSTDGINYALKAMADDNGSSNIAAHARGLTGWAAVNAIAHWERSADIPGQAESAWRTYAGWLGDNIPIALAGVINIITGGGQKKQVEGGTTEGGGNVIVPIPNDGIDIPGSTTTPGTTTTTTDPHAGGVQPQDIRLGAVGPFNVGIPSGLILGLLGLALLLIGAIMFGYGGAMRVNVGTVGANVQRTGMNLPTAARRLSR